MAPSPLFEDKALFQMKFYALVLWRLHGVVPRLLQLVYLGDGEVVRYAPDEADPTVQFNDAGRRKVPVLVGMPAYRPGISG